MARIANVVRGELPANGSRVRVAASLMAFVFIAAFSVGGAQQACTFDDGYNGVIIHQSGDSNGRCPEGQICTGANKCSLTTQGVEYCSNVDPDGYCTACQEGYALGYCGDGDFAYSGQDYCSGPEKIFGTDYFDTSGYGGCIKCGENCPAGPQSSSGDIGESSSSCVPGSQGSCEEEHYDNGDRRCNRCPTTQRYCLQYRYPNENICACKICAGVKWSQNSIELCCNQATNDGEGEKVKPTCLTTQYYSGSLNACKPCPAGFECGNWFGGCTEQSECKPGKTCPKGKYFDSGNCKQCDVGKTSKAGSTSKDHCTIECPADSYLSETFGRCQKCVWPKTSPQGSLSESNCRKKVCVAGEYLDEGNDGSPVCYECEPGKTSSAGAERVSGCKAECVKGEYLNAKNECVQCKKDQCGVVKTTPSQGATSSSMCVEDLSKKRSFGDECDSNDQCRQVVVGDETTSCTCRSHCCDSLGMSTGCVECADDGDCAVCEAGYYLGWKYNIYGLDWCEMCPDGKTSKRGSTSSDDCGYGPNAAGDACPNGRFDCILGQCLEGICCSELGSEPGTLSCAEGTGDGKSCSIGFYLGNNVVGFGGDRCKACGDGETTSGTGKSSSSDCIPKFADGEACSDNSQCTSNSCKGGRCCNLEKDSPGCTTCNSGDGFCAHCKAGYVLNENLSSCAACRPKTMSKEGVEASWNVEVDGPYPPSRFYICVGTLNVGDVCDHHHQCQLAKCNQHCCKDFYKGCDLCNEDGLCTKCTATFYITNDGNCKQCDKNEDDVVAYSDPGSTDPSACYFKNSIDNGGTCRFDKPDACKSGICRVNCCAESNDGCLNCDTNGGCSKCDDNYFMENKYSVCEDSKFETEEEKSILGIAGICNEGEPCNFDCSLWQNNYGGNCNDEKSFNGFPLMKEKCPDFCQLCDTKTCTACPKYTTSKRGSNIGEGSCKKIEDGNACFTDESCASGVCKGSCCSLNYKDKDCIQCGSDGQCMQCGESALDMSKENHGQCCTAADKPYSGCMVPDCTSINNPKACKPQVCTSKDVPYEGCHIPYCTAVNSPFAGCIPQSCTAKDTPYEGCREVQAFCTNPYECDRGQECSGTSTICPEWCPSEWDYQSFSKGCAGAGGVSEILTVDLKQSLRCSTGCKCCKYKDGVKVVALQIILRGVSASTFNSDPGLISAFKDTVTSLLVGVYADDIYDVRAKDISSDRRRRLDTISSCIVNYKILRCSSQCSKNAESLTNSTFTKALRENMDAWKVKSVPLASVFAEVLPKEKSGSQSGSQSVSQSSDTTSSSTSKTSKGEETGGGGDAGLVIAMLFIFVILPGIAAGFAYWKRDYLKEKWTEYRETKSSTSTTSKNASLEMSNINSVFVRRSAQAPEPYKNSAVEDTADEDELPKLYTLLKELTLAAWINKCVLHGIHTTEMLLSDVDDDVLTELGMRSQQRRRLLEKIEELRRKRQLADDERDVHISVTSAIYEETDQEEQAYAKPARGGWRHRFSVNAGCEYFENSLTGETTFETPELFGGENSTEQEAKQDSLHGDSNEAEDISLSVCEQLKHGRLPADLWPKIETEFGGDITAVSDDWIDAQDLPRLKVRRLKALCAKARGVLWYHGKTGDYEFWMNATTEEYQYMPPVGEDNYIMPAPRDYFEDCNRDVNKQDEAEEELSTAAPKWRRARAKLKTIERIKALGKARTKSN